MPAAMIRNPAGAFGEPLFASAGVNEQLLMEVVNNTGMPIIQGFVVCWDTFTAISTITDVLNNAAFSGTIASQTVTANASTAAYASAGLINVNGVTYAAAGTTCPTALANIIAPLTFYYGALSGSTFTGAQAPVNTATSGVPISAPFFNGPQGPNFLPVAGLPAIATASDGGRAVTLSQLTTLGALVAKDPQVAGVCSPTGDAGTNGAIINPLDPFLMCVAGMARVYVANATVAALANLCTAAGVPGGADDATPTLGNMLGISQEANTAKDTNNTIRAIIKLG